MSRILEYVIVRWKVLCFLLYMIEMRMTKTRTVKPHQLPGYGSIWEISYS